VRYRLAPQNPFPASLLDALISYLYLLYPPPGALHEPIPSSKIVFAGDSAGGNLFLALLQLILQLHRTAPSGQTPTVKFHGKDVEIPIPAGVAGNSPWMDVTRSFPSIEGNAKYDYVPPPSHSAALTFPQCEIWPAKPPRVDIYCDGNAMLHPLVSPLAARDWKGAPPVFIGCGEEMLADEDAAFAQKLVKQGVTVVWEQYEAMPHCFAMMLEGHKGGNMFFDEWAGFIKTAVEKPGDLKTRGTIVTPKKLVRKSVDIATLRSWSEDEVLKMMKNAQDNRLKGFETEAKALPKL
jgi:acetyl esterase/lipase